MHAGMTAWPAARKYEKESMKKNPALQDSPPAAGRTSDIFHSAAVRSSRSVFISRKAISYEIEKAPVPKGTEAKILIATCVEFHIPAYALIITVRVSVSAYCKVRAALVSPFTQIRNTAFPPPAAMKSNSPKTEKPITIF